jgi:Zn ribbon nucleic-acid-binding protein
VNEPPPVNRTPNKCPVCGGTAAEGEFVGENTVEVECNECGHKWRQYIPD